MQKSVRERFLEGLTLCLPEKSTKYHVLIALSGGADSVALLRLFLEMAKKEAVTLSACHVHHGIRGAAADRDAAFCEKLCKEHAVAFYPMYVDVPSACRAEGGGMEETARKLRYAALLAVAQQNGCDFIATAHNADDHLETVLFHLARGSGARGMQGIAPRRENIIRPLLGVTKSEILSFLSDLGQDFVWDSTNEDDDLTRNYIRHTILPAMRHINAEAARASLSMSEAIRQDETFLCSLLPKEDCDLSALPDPLLWRALDRQYRAAGGKGAAREHYRALVRLVKQGKEGQMLSLPGNVTARRVGTRLIFEDTLRKKKKETVCAEKFPVLRENDRELSQNPQIRVVSCDELKKVYNLAINTAVDSAILEGELYWRYRLPGDTIQIGGMKRQVRELLRQLGLQADKRGRYPIVCDEKGPLWVPGFPVRDDRRSKQIGFYLVYCE